MSFGQTCIGASAGGTLTELIALGAADKYLTMNPTITFWRFRYNKYTNFALEAIEQPFASNVGFGTDVQVTLNRTGDLIYFQYVVIDLPGIRAVEPTKGVCGIGQTQFPCCDPCDPCADGPPPECICCNQPASSVPPEEFDIEYGADYFEGVPGISSIDACTGVRTPWCNYVNAIGQYLIRRCCLVIGGQVIDTVFNDYLYMWEELSGRPGARLTEMVGKRYTRTQLIADSLENRRLYVPIPFFYTQTSGNALPLVSLQFHGVQIHVCFADLQQCVQVSSCDVLVVKCRDCQPLSAQDMNARLDTTYVYLDVAERDRFAVGSFEQLITQLQSYGLCTKSCQIRLQLNFNHPVIELIWAVRRKCQSQCNNHFNYSGRWGRDPLQAVHLRFNNLPRFTGREARYFRLVQPYQFHTDIPDAFVYCYSFALHPEDPQPSGSVNFSRIDNVEMIMEIQEALVEKGDELQVIVFAKNWNIFRYRDGLGGLAFAN